MAPSTEIKKVAMIGCGSMGGGMALLFSEHGLSVALEDPSKAAMEKIKKEAEEGGFGDRISMHEDYKSLCEALDEPKVFVWSLPHGTAGDSVLDGLLPHLEKGDIIIDCANEHWENSERRQGKTVTRGVRYVACGVSGGYQAARRGPSFCPGSDDETLELVLPLLQKVAAKGPDGRPCAAAIGTGGAGHYVKMMHNGIEHGMMSAVAEAWGIMVNGLGMSYDEVAETLKKWDAEGELKGTFLVNIGIRINTAKDPKTGEKVLSTIEDKVVQDVTGEEGTGVWSNETAIHEHIPAPTLTTAHDWRLASSDHRQRVKAKEAMGASFPPQKLDVKDKEAFLKDLHLAVFASCLASYVQGMLVIDRANRDHHWNINYANVLQIWRAGCIIKSDYIAELLKPVLEGHKSKDSLNLLYEASIMQEFKKGKPSLQRVIARAVENDHVVPAMSATLEWIKYQTGLDLPTSFYEAELDYFGNHMYDRKDDDPEGLPKEGKYSFEWKPA